MILRVAALADESLFQAQVPIPPDHRQLRRRRPPLSNRVPPRKGKRKIRVAGGGGRRKKFPGPEKVETEQSSSSLYESKRKVGLLKKIQRV